MSVPRESHRRLLKDYQNFVKSKPPYLSAAPNPSNILEWHYCIQGPERSPYEGGYYHGMLKFPPEYPFKPPQVLMITPSGRFQTNTRLCLSMSDYHPDTWNPAWSVETILTGLLSFMLEDTDTVGSIVTNFEAKRQFARLSGQHNLGNARFVELFPELCEKIRSEHSSSSSVSSSPHNQTQNANTSATTAAATQAASAAASPVPSNHTQAFLFNMFVVVIACLFMMTVKKVVEDAQH